MLGHVKNIGRSSQIKKRSAMTTVKTLAEAANWPKQPNREETSHNSVKNIGRSSQLEKKSAMTTVSKTFAKAAQLGQLEKNSAI